MRFPTAHIQVRWPLFGVQVNYKTASIGKKRNQVIRIVWIRYNRMMYIHQSTSHMNECAGSIVKQLKKDWKCLCLFVCLLLQRTDYSKYFKLPFPYGRTVPTAIEGVHIILFSQANGISIHKHTYIIINIIIIKRNKNQMIRRLIRFRWFTIIDSVATTDNTRNESNYCVRTQWRLRAPTCTQTHTRTHTHFSETTNTTRPNRFHTISNDQFIGFGCCYVRKASAHKTPDAKCASKNKCTIESNAERTASTSIH